MPGTLDLYLGNQSVTLTLVGQELTVEQGLFAATLAWLTAPASSAPDNLPFPVQPSVQLLSGLGLPLAGVVVTFVLVSGSASRIGITVATTDATGTATWVDVGLNALGSLPGSATVLAQALTLPDQPATPNVAVALVAVPSTLEVLAMPVAGVDTVAFPVQPRFQVRDQNGDPFRQAGIPVTATLVTGAGLLLGDVTVESDVNGEITFTDLAIDDAAS